MKTYLCRVIFLLFTLFLCFSLNISAQNKNNKSNDWVELAYNKIQKGDLKGALKDYDKAIAAQPQESILYQNRGALRYEMKDFEGAIQDCEKAVALDANLFNAYFNLGILYYQLQDFKKALENLNTFIKLKKQDAEAYYWRGKVKQQLKDKTGACTDWREAKRLGSIQVNDLLTNYCNKNQESSLEK